MPVGVGASGFLGIAPETTAGTYLAPTKFLVLRSENLNVAQDTVWRRPLRGIADVAGAVPGNSRVEGNITVELTSDTLPHILRAARATGVKTGATTPYTYTFTPSAVAIPAKTLSVTVVRNGVAFGYVGCIVTSQKYSIDNGLLIGSFDILGTSEASQSVPTPTYVTAGPFGAGQYDLQIPAASSVTDTDTFELTIDDNGSAEYRLKNTGTGAAFIRYGERSVSLDLNRDFIDRTDYDAFKALTAQAIKLTASKGANDSISFDLFAAIKDTYEISGLSGQADLVRAHVVYNGTYSNADSAAYKITILTSEAITPFP